MSERWRGRQTEREKKLIKKEREIRVG